MLNGMKKFKLFRCHNYRPRSHNNKNRHQLPPKSELYDIVDFNMSTLQNSGIPNVAIIFKSEFDYISRCILDYKNLETGGQLFGYWTAENVPVVLYAIGPGPKANHQTAFFNQDIDYLKRVGKPLVEDFGLQHIGEWHSHHKLGLAQPSSHDSYTMSSTINEKHLRHFLLCIGNCTDYESTLNAFNYVEKSNSYAKAYWCIKNIESPFRKVVDETLKPFLLHPQCEFASHGHINFIKLASAEIKPEYKESYWFSNKENRRTVKKIIDYIGQLPNPGRCSIQLDENGFITMTISYSDHVDQFFFPDGFPKTSPKITRIHGNDFIQSLDFPWNPKGEIFEDFIKYYNRTVEEL